MHEGGDATRDTYTHTHTGTFVDNPPASLDQSICSDVL